MEFKRRYLCKGKQQLFRFCKITHPSYNEGAKVVTLTLKILDKTDGKTVLGTRDYVLYIETKLATYSLDVTAKNEKGEIIDNAKVSVFDSRNIEQNPSSLSANTEYTLTVSALGYVRDVRKITLTQNTKLDVILKEGATVDFTVKLATGTKTDYATLKVTSANGSQTYSPIEDEYGYETSQFELTPANINTMQLIKVAVKRQRVHLLSQRVQSHLI